MTALLAEPAEGRLTGLWSDTRRCLQPLGLHAAPLADGLACAAGGGGRLRLQAARWQLGLEDCPLAECRLVQIRGQAVEIVNALIFPHDPTQAPLFVAELLVTGGCPRLTFLDLQPASAAPALRERVRQTTHALARQFPEVPPADDVPAWAVEFSTGGYLFTRTTEPNHLPALLALYRGYLAGWVALAQAARPDPAADATLLTRFKQAHLAHWPGTAYLDKLFGQEWTARFLTQFLYQ